MINIDLTDLIHMEKIKYSSKSQLARINTEAWASKHLKCQCGGDLHQEENNKKVVDFTCIECGRQFQLKAQNKKFGTVLTGAEYYTFIEYLKNHTMPDFICMHYEMLNDVLTVKDLFIIPGEKITADVVIKRKPLSETAKRAGWTGYNLDLKKLKMWYKRLDY
jgi:type II restriction enzyme